MSLEFIPCTIEHIDDLLPRISQADLTEIDLSVGIPPRDALIESMKTSKHSWSLMDESARCLGVFGYACPLPDPEIGVPWLIASDELRGRRVELHKLGIAWVDTMKAQCPKLLFNYVHVDNKRAIHWLKRLGFSFEDPAPFGAKQALFHCFYK